MTDTDPRNGSPADLARRMDRIEQRQDKMDSSLTTLTQTVDRVELNQKHADELGLLRHESVKTGLDTLTGTVGAFITRIEGIIDGSIQTAQTRQGAEVMAAYVSFRDKTLERLDAMEDRQSSADARQGGIVIALSGVKAAILMGIGLAGPIVALIVGWLKP